MLDSYPHPIILAHRGASALAPENTLEAFQLAFEQGADGVELDAKLSADGEVVVIHDATVDRTTDGRGRVASRRLAELRGLDAGRAFSPEYQGARIPTLNEVFEAVGHRGIINVELTNYYGLPDGLAEKVCALVKRHSLQEHIILSSFLPYNLSIAARILPDVPRALLALPGWKGAWSRSFGFMFGNYQALHANYRDADRQQVQRVHRLDRRIHVWAVNAAEDIERMIALEIDGIITANPPMALNALGRSR